MKHVWKHWWRLLLALLLLPMGCTSTTPPAQTQALVIYAWAEYIPAQVLAGFTAETGIPIQTITYGSVEEALAQLRAHASFDLVLVGNEYIPRLVAEGLLAPIDLHDIPNFRNVGVNFRDLVHDPGNKYSVPYDWGTTGLLVRTDLVEEPVTHWSALWDERYRGRVALWRHPDSLVAIALAALGYPVSTTDPAALEQAVAQIARLNAHAIALPDDAPTSIPWLASGEAVLTFGWAYDAALAQEADVPIAYIQPEVGSSLWMESLVIPAASPNHAAAVRFLDFILRPEIGAMLVNLNFYAVPNEAARPLVDPAILADPAIYPRLEEMGKIAWSPVVTPEIEQVYADVWAMIDEPAGQ